MAGRKVRDIEEARACLAAMAASNIPLAKWARTHGLDGRSLNLWKLNLTRTPRPTRRQAPPEVRLVELVATAPCSTGRYRICLGEFAVEVDGAFDDTVLRRLLGVVARC